MTYFYSKAVGGFISDEVTSLIPADAIEITVEYHQKLLDKQSNGYEIVVNDDTVLAVIPEPKIFTIKELIAIADAEKSRRLAAAKDIIEPLSDAVDFDDATGEEVAVLKVWKKYRLALTRIDTSSAPNIDWPEIPA